MKTTGTLLMGALLLAGCAGGAETAGMSVEEAEMACFTSRRRS